jgi:hypothetical protein
MTAPGSIIDIKKSLALGRFRQKMKRIIVPPSIYFVTNRKIRFFIPS